MSLMLQQHAQIFAYTSTSAKVAPIHGGDRLMPVLPLLVPGTYPARVEWQSLGAGAQVQVGRVLAGMEARDGAAVAGALHEARAEIIPPLAAGSTESYARAHPHLARLHMLQELQDAAALLQARPRPPCPRLPPATSCRVPPFIRTSCCMAHASSACTRQALHIHIEHGITCCHIVLTTMHRLL